MATTKNRIHMICGFCGCKDEFMYQVKPEGACNNDGIEYPEVYILCYNCTSSTALSEVITRHPKDSTVPTIKDS